MLSSHFIFKIFFRGIHKGVGAIIAKINEQIRVWRRADLTMGWGIDNKEFEMLEASMPKPLTDRDRKQGFIGFVLFYGYGDDGHGNSDAVFSGKLAWEYAIKRRRGKTWQCEY